MALDGIVIHSIITELQTLVGARVDRILEPENNTIILGVYSHGMNYALNLNISAENYRVNLTTHSKPNPAKCPNFCMVLRKNLIGYKISRIYMNGLERICYIEFEGLDNINNIVIKTISIELMGKYSNIVLLNQDFKILDCYKRYGGNSETNSRTIIPGKYYMLPNTTKKDIFKISYDEFESDVLQSNENTIDLAISNIYNGISKLFIESCENILKISNTISEKSISEIYNYIFEILNKNFKCVFCKNSYTIIKSDLGRNLQVNFFIDDFYYNKETNDFYNDYRNNLLKIINFTLDKITKKLFNINRKIEACQKKDEYKLYGELLLTAISKYSNTDLSLNNISKIDVLNYYNNELIHIPIDNSKSISDNSQKYFKKYTKMKNTLDIVTIQKKEAENELNYLESILYELDNCNNINELNLVYNEISENILFNDSTKLRKSNSKNQDIVSLTNYLKFKIDDFDVLVGKNNKQNDYLTKKVASKNDIWFHTKDIHGSHVILKCDGIIPKISIIEKCASLSAYYSKARFSSHVPVDYTFVKYVKKPNGAAPGFVIYTNNKTIYVTPDSGLNF